MGMGGVRTGLETLGSFLMVGLYVKVKNLEEVVVDGFETNSLRALHYIPIFWHSKPAGFPWYFLQFGLGISVVFPQHFLHNT